MHLNLVSDHALGESPARSADGLEFTSYARVLATVARDTPGPFTIGVFGDWGSGKTSLMRLTREELSADPSIVTVWFNAWRYEKEEHPIVPLIGTIIQELAAHKSLLDRVGEPATLLLRALRAIAYGFSMKAKLKVPGFAEVETAFSTKDAIERAENLMPDAIMNESLYYGAFQALDSADISNELKVVIFIDDLDRCFPDQAIKLLESIKLVLSQPGFIFTLGVARKVVEGYLHHRYSQEFGIADFNGALYLDKIVQLPFHIPPSVDRMQDFCRTLLTNQDQSIVDQLGPVLPVIGAALGGNPRAMVRFLNNVLIDTAINSTISSAKPVPISFFAVSRCIQQRWPDILEILYRRPEVATAIARWEAAVPEPLVAAAETNTPEGHIATQVISDQELAHILLSNAAKAWLLDMETRRASIDFLVTRERVTLDEFDSKASEYEVFVSCMPGDRAGALELLAAISPDHLRTRLEEGLGTSPASRKALEQAWLVLVCFGQEQWPLFQLQELESTIQGKIVLPVLLPGATITIPESNILPQSGPDFSGGIAGAEIANLREYIQRHRSRRGGDAAIQNTHVKTSD